MKKLAIITGFAVITTCGQTQQLQQLSQYLQNPYLINPAAAGIQDFVDLNLSFRQQWVGFDNAPQTFYFSGNSVVGKVGSAPKYNPSLRTSRPGAVKVSGNRTGMMRHTVGANVMSDKYGAFNRLMFSGSYAIHIPITKGLNISCGVGGGMSNLAYDRSKVDLLGDDNLDPTYVAFLGSTQKQNLFDLNFGLFLYTNALTFGYSNAQVMQNKIYFGDPTKSKLNAHHYIMGGYRFDINEQLSVTPNFLVKYMNPAPVAVDINCKVDYNDLIFGGVSYRHKDAIVGLLGVMFKNFKLGYSYDYTISSLKKHNSGGHEIILGYKVKL
ncbi:MAG: type IX secretion system membrane protein PorP/SprF [Bacteroidota bacterium]